MPVEAPFRTQITVAGMTCPHCVASVTEEVGAIDGVSRVDARLATGVVTVLADRAVDRTELAAALAVAGFDIAG